MPPLPSYTVHVHRAGPALAELHIDFVDLPADVAVHGRLMGPRCPGVSTIEVAYPIQRRAESHSAFKAVIPEPTFWSEERPYVYSGPVELLRSGVLLGTITVSVGIRAGIA